MDSHIEGGLFTSNPKPPYYYKYGQDTYHWETSCSKNKYSENDSKWVKTNTRPTKAQCNECKQK